MGVCIWKCNKDQDNIVKESSIDCFKKSEQSIFANVITSNNIYEDKKLMKIKYKKLFNDTKDNKEKENINIISPLNNNQNINYTFSNNATASNSTWNEKYVKNVIKIQNFYRNHIRRKANKNKLMINKDKEDTNIFLKLNLEMVETVHSSNSLNNSNISRENINNGEEGGDYKIIEKCRGYKGKEYKEIINNDIIHFNIKNKLSYMHYKYSGYVKRKTKILLGDSPQIKTDNSNSIEEKEIIDNEEKSGLIKEDISVRELENLASTDEFKRNTPINREKKDNEYFKITMNVAIDIIKKYNLTPSIITGGVNRYVGIPFEGSEVTEFNMRKR